MIENPSVVDTWSKASLEDRAAVIRANVPDRPWLGLFLLGAITLPAIVRGIEQAWQEAKDAHRRKARLEAYRSRHQWRKADLPRLQQLGVGRVATKPLERITTKKLPGRGVVRAYEPLGESLLSQATDIVRFFDQNTSSKDRIQLLQRSAIFPEVIEALNRGEYGAARAARMKSPFEHATAAVAEHFRISEAKVRKICTKARTKRAEYGDDASLQPMRLDDFDHWARTGGDFG